MKITALTSKKEKESVVSMNYEKKKKKHQDVHPSWLTNVLSELAMTGSVAGFCQENNTEVFWSFMRL